MHLSMMHPATPNSKALEASLPSHPVDESTITVLRDFVGAASHLFHGAQESASSGPDGLSLTEVAAIMVAGKTPDSTKSCSSTHSK
jgi:hypothetical protein